MQNYLNEYVTADDIYVRYAIDPEPNDREFQMHVHSKCEIYCFLAGNAEYCVEGARYPLERGSVLIMRPSESHRTRILGDKKYERYAMNFPVSAADSLDGDHRLLRPFFDRPLGIGNLFHAGELPDVRIENLFERMFSAEDDYERDMNTRVGMFVMLYALSAAFRERSSTDMSYAQSITGRILSYINVHLGGELSTSGIAEEFHVSRSQLSRIVKEATGTSVWEYITVKRLTLAKEKIRAGMAAARAGEACGFGDYSSFYRAYVKHFGVSPREKTDDRVLLGQH